MKEEVCESKIVEGLDREMRLVLRYSSQKNIIGKAWMGGRKDVLKRKEVAK